MTVSDLDKIEAEFLKQCGHCDAGLPTACVCSDRDYRPTMSGLLGEVATLRRVMLDVSRRLHGHSEMAYSREEHAFLVQCARELRAEAGQ